MTQLLAPVNPARERFVAHLHAYVVFVVAAHLAALMSTARFLLLASTKTPLGGACLHTHAALHRLGLFPASAPHLNVAFARAALARVTRLRAHVKVTFGLVVCVVGALEETFALFLACWHRVAATRADDLVAEEQLTHWSFAARTVD